MSSIIPANTLASGGYAVDNSLRFNSASNDYLSRVESSTQGSATKASFSAWIKRSNISSNYPRIISILPSSNNGLEIFFRNTDTLEIKVKFNGATRADLQTNRVFRDTSAWYHILVSIDSTSGTADDRIRLYVNGVKETSFGTRINPDQNANIKIAAPHTFQIGAEVGGSSNNFNGYISELVWMDGTAHGISPESYFGEFNEDSGIWQPISVSGLTFGTNGFYLDFENSGSLGADVSGNGNNFTVNNLTTIDQTTDTCTNNFATMNPLDNFWQGFAFSDGNTTVTTTNASQSYSTSSIMVSSGKWYVECKPVSGGSEPEIGVAIKMVGVNAGNNAQLSYNANGYAYRASNPGSVWYNGSAVSTSFSQYANGDIIGIALDLDNNKLYFRKNAEAWGNSGDPTSGSTGTGAISIVAPTSTTLGAYAFAMNETFNDQNKVFSWNFGNAPFAISSGNTDGNGRGNFEYAVPDGYLSLNTKNLSEELS